MIRRFPTALLTSIALISGGGTMTAQTSVNENSALKFRGVAADYFEQVYFKYSPTEGTQAGLHQYDPKLEDYSRAEIEREIADLRMFATKFDAISPVALDESTRGDLAMVRNNIRGNLLELETIRPWEKNPDTYSSGIANSAFVLMERKFAPADERLRSLIAREKQMPAVFIAARQNLKNSPRVYTEIALEQLPDIISFFEKDVPEAFADAKDPRLIAEFHETNTAVISSLRDYEQWVKTDLLPRSNGDFRIGSDTFSKKLLYDEMVDTSLDKLLTVAYADLHRNQEEFERVAKEVDPSKTPKEVLAEPASIHPSPDELLPTFRSTFRGLIGFIRDKHIITIPSDVQPVLEETPPFMRATTQASMDSPGPFETNSTTAAFNVGTIISTSVHEACPGHYVQFLWVNHADLSQVRKIITANTNVEGWAHYCEQMMLDQGYGQPGVGAKDAREAKLIRLGQLQDALL